MTAFSVYPYLMAAGGVTMLATLAIAVRLLFASKTAGRGYARARIYGSAGEGLVATSTKALSLRGATVVAFDCEGCMAHDHQLQYIGRVDGFERRNST